MSSSRTGTSGWDRAPDQRIEAGQALRRRISVLVADGVLGAEDTAGLVEDGP
jgi:hypothetical protein